MLFRHNYKIYRESFNVFHGFYKAEFRYNAEICLQNYNNIYLYANFHQKYLQNKNFHCNFAECVFNLSTLT